MVLSAKILPGHGVKELITQYTKKLIIIAVDILIPSFSLAIDYFIKAKESGDKALLICLSIG